MRPSSGRVARGLSWCPFLFVLHFLIISPALLLTLVDSDFKLPFETIDGIDKRGTQFPSPLPVYLIAFDQSNEQWKRFERELSHLPPNLTATIHLKRAPAVTMADLKAMLERKSSFLRKARQRVYTGLTRNRDVAQKLAHTLSHLKAIQQAYDDGHESVLIVEDSAVMNADYLQNVKAYTLIAPVDWSILQWTTSNIAVNKKNSHRSNDFWVSWYGYHWSTLAYSIRREGMNRILIQTSKYLNQTENGTLIWRLDQLNILRAEELIYFYAGKTYTSTYSWFSRTGGEERSNPATKAKESQPVPRIDDFHKFQRPESIAILQNIRIRSVEEMQEEIQNLDTDIRVLSFFNPRSKWFVKVVLTSSAFLPNFHNMTSRFQVDHDQFQVKTSTNPFNKFDFVHQNLHILPSFDFVLLKDNDIRLAGFEWNTFMDKKKDALISAPYHVRIEDTIVSRRRQLSEAKMSAGSVVSLQDGALFNTYRDANFQDVTSGSVLALEMFMVLMKPDFAVWFLGQTLTSDFLKQHVDWGPDLKCGVGPLMTM